MLTSSNKSETAVNMLPLPWHLSCRCVVELYGDLNVRSLNLQMFRSFSSFASLSLKLYLFGFILSQAKNTLKAMMGSSGHLRPHGFSLHFRQRHSHNTPVLLLFNSSSEQLANMSIFLSEFDRFYVLKKQVVILLYGRS